MESLLTTDFIVLIILIAFLVIISLFSSSTQQPTRHLNRHNPYGYKTKPSVMSRSESAFFYELQKQLPEGHYIFPKMRVADILDIPNGHTYYKLRNKALPKHIDFLICDRFFKPKVAIEVNGTSHNRYKQRISDGEKVKMFEGSGISLETINVGSDFNSSIHKIISTL